MSIYKFVILVASISFTNTMVLFDTLWLMTDEKMGIAILWWIEMQIFFYASLNKPNTHAENNLF